MNEHLESTEKLHLVKGKKNAAVIIAHPDDETLWCGGTMLLHPDYNWFVACLCRRNDTDRAPKFKEALKFLKSEGRMGDLDDSPEQSPLNENMVQEAILKLLPKQHFDLILTHSPYGEYTRHLRHEEIGSAVIALWNDKKLTTKKLLVFAYEDGGNTYYPKAIVSAGIYHKLPKIIWEEKYRLITQVYGFNPLGFEAKSTPKTEAFWKFKNPKEALKWVDSEHLIRSIN